MYLQTNPGGITIFGWIVDRSLVNTIFFLELTLVTFVLSKTILWRHKLHSFDQEKNILVILIENPFKYLLILPHQWYTKLLYTAAMHRGRKEAEEDYPMTRTLEHSRSQWIYCIIAVNRLPPFQGNTGVSKILILICTFHFIYNFIDAAIRQIMLANQ